MKVQVVTGDPRTLTALKVNARYMRHETFQRLVSNLRQQGTLTSTPFVWKATQHEPGTDTPTGYADGDLVIISGNHRVQAAIEAGITEITWLQTDDPLTLDERTALQLSHNALTGDDDPAILQTLYEQISTVEWKQFAALDDEHLGLLNEVSFDTLKPANLSFQTLALTFLPPDYAEAMEAFEEARQLSTGADATWLAQFEDHTRLLRALDEVGKSHNVKNMGAALQYVINIYRAHRDDLAAGFMTPDGEAAHTGRVPLAAALGTDELPAVAAIDVNKALKKMQERGEVGKTDTWEAVHKWAQAYLAGK